MKRKLSVAVFCLLLIASFTFSFLLPSLLGLPRTGLNAQPLEVVTFSRRKLPAIASHIASAQKAGKPRVLRRTTNQQRIRSNRRAACRNFKPAPGYSCDEYPFASTYEGGAGAAIRGVPVREQHIQGAVLSTFYRTRGIKDGTRFGVRVVR